jgi:hypothetical protein
MVDDYEAPAGSRLWSSSYARLLVCPLPEAGDHSELERRLRKAEAWLDEIILEHEDRGSPLDGYLVLLLAAPPGLSLGNRLREIELDPAFCRKHVLWSEGGAGWKRQLERVSVLALADTPSPAEPAILPELPHRAAEVWKMSSEGKSIRSVAEHVLSLVGVSGTEVADEG